ncbi:MAG: PspC domain-containing protein [Rhodothermales bacterium]|nr:PspC domain-containing protein [Rhodothermales bacterium]MBO6779873.1 PspC domain-containing protein [Rhodothermales bacterium]
MATRTRKGRSTELAEEEGRIDPILFGGEQMDLEDLSEDELEDILFAEEERTPNGFFNLPTIAGFSLILVGIAYIFQQLGFWPGVDLSVLATMLPWLAGILIILLGFGVLSWRPGRKPKPKKMTARERRAQKAAEKAEVKAETRAAKSRRREERTSNKLRKSRDKKLAGVAGGIAEYFSIDPTLVRIAFVIGTIASGGPFFLAYLLLAFVMPNPEKQSFEERITIIRDS